MYILDGFYLNEEERMRRFLIKSLIDGGRLNPQEFKKQFGKDISEVDILNELFERKWLEEKNIKIESIESINEDGSGSFYIRDKDGNLIYMDTTLPELEEAVEPKGK